MMQMVDCGMKLNIGIKNISPKKEVRESYVISPIISTLLDWNGCNSSESSKKNTK